MYRSEASASLQLIIDSVALIAELHDLSTSHRALINS